MRPNNSIFAATFDAMPTGISIRGGTAGHVTFVAHQGLTGIRVDQGDDDWRGVILDLNALDINRGDVITFHVYVEDVDASANAWTPTLRANEIPVEGSDRFGNALGTNDGVGTGETHTDGNTGVFTVTIEANTDPLIRIRMVNNGGIYVIRDITVVPVAPEVAARFELEDLVQLAEELVADAEFVATYTEATRTALTGAIAAAILVYEDDDATLEELQEAYSDLDDAIDELETV